MIRQGMERNDVKRILEEMRFNSPISSVYFLTDNPLYDPEGYITVPKNSNKTYEIIKVKSFFKLKTIYI